MLKMTNYTAIIYVGILTWTLWFSPALADEKAFLKNHDVTVAVKGTSTKLTIPIEMINANDTCLAISLNYDDGHVLHSNLTVWDRMNSDILPNVTCIVSKTCAASNQSVECRFVPLNLFHAGTYHIVSSDTNGLIQGEAWHTLHVMKEVKLVIEAYHSKGKKILVYQRAVVFDNPDIRIKKVATSLKVPSGGRVWIECRFTDVRLRGNFTCFRQYNGNYDGRKGELIQNMSSGIDYNVTYPTKAHFNRFDVICFITTPVEGLGTITLELPIIKGPIVDGANDFADDDEFVKETVDGSSTAEDPSEMANSDIGYFVFCVLLGLVGIPFVLFISQAVLGQSEMAKPIDSACVLLGLVVVAFGLISQTDAKDNTKPVFAFSGSNVKLSFRLSFNIKTAALDFYHLDGADYESIWIRESGKNDREPVRFANIKRTEGTHGSNQRHIVLHIDDALVANDGTYIMAAVGTNRQQTKITYRLHILRELQIQAETYIDNADPESLSYQDKAVFHNNSGTSITMSPKKLISDESTKVRFTVKVIEGSGRHHALKVNFVCDSEYDNNDDLQNYPIVKNGVSEISYEFTNHKYTQFEFISIVCRIESLIQDYANIRVEVPIERASSQCDLQTETCSNNQEISCDNFCYNNVIGANKQHQLTISISRIGKSTTSSSGICCNPQLYLIMLTFVLWDFIKL